MEGQGESHEEAGEGHGTAGMSPHEIEELQRKNCIFCHISAGKVPARKVYEDNECLAVLDINPATPGHMLLMPKEHYTVMFQVPEQALGHIFVIAKGLSQAGLKAFQGKGNTIFAANGVAAGQRAPHFMLHIIPRSQGDNAGLYIPSRALGTKEAEQIATALSASLGYRKQPPTHSEEKKEGEKHNKERTEAVTDLDSITDFLAGSKMSKGGGGKP